LHILCLHRRVNYVSDEATAAFIRIDLAWKIDA